MEFTQREIAGGDRISDLKQEIAAKKELVRDTLDYCDFLVFDARSHKIVPQYSPEFVQSWLDECDARIQDLRQLKAELREAQGGLPGRIRSAIGTVGVKLVQLVRPSKPVAELASSADSQE